MEIYHERIKDTIYIIDCWYDQSGLSEQYYLSPIYLDNSAQGIRPLSTNIAHCEEAIGKAYISKILQKIKQ